MVFDSMVKICITGIISVIFILILKPKNAQLALILSLVTSILIFLFITPYLTSLFSFFKEFSNYMDSKTLYLDVVIKIICVTYICEIASSICSDSKEEAIATKIELGGKVIIMVLSLPIISEILKTVVTIL